MSSVKAGVQLSAIVPVGIRHTDILSLYSEYKAAVASTGLRFEFIFVLDGSYPEISKSLEDLIRAGENITLVSLTRLFGEATALMAGFEHAAGERILTLPAYHQIVSTEIVKLVAALDST